MRDLRAYALSMSQLPGMPELALPAQRRVGTCESCGGGTYKGRSTCIKCEKSQAVLSRRFAQVPAQPRPRVPCWICAKPMISHGAERPTCGACRQKYGACVCSQCGGPKRDAKPGMCRACIPVRPKPEPRTCKLCEEFYVPREPDQSFCSKSCATAWHNGARPPYERQVVTGMARKVALARARRLRHAQTWDGIPDEEILERDGWRCQIPGCKRRPIRKDLKYPHPRSKSIDHIIPLSHGGDDTAENKRAAHFGCNVARGNEMGDEQVALFGVIREAPLVTRTHNGATIRPPKPPRLCGICGEPLVEDKCSLHLRVYFLACDRCGGWFAAQTTRGKRRYCSDACRKQLPRAPMSAEARDRKRKRDRERRWVDPDYRARALAATARWHDRQRTALVAEMEAAGG